MLQLLLEAPDTLVLGLREAREVLVSRMQHHGELSEVFRQGFLRSVLFVNLTRQVLQCLSDQFVLLDELLRELSLAMLILIELFDHEFDQAAHIVGFFHFFISAAGAPLIVIERFEPSLCCLGAAVFIFFQLL